MNHLQDICHLITDGKHGDCQNEEGSGYYFVSCKDVKDGWLDHSDARQITESDFVDTHRRTQLQPNDILITNSGTIGRMALVPNIPEVSKTTFQKSVAIIKPNIDIVLPSWLYYYLYAKKNELIAWAGGTAQKNLLLRDLRAFEISVPSFHIQHNIAAILSAYDDLIKNNTKRIKILEEMAQIIYNEWFVKFKFPGHENVKMVESELGMIPEGWEVKKLEQVCTTVTDGSHWSPKSVDKGLPMASVKDMHNWGFNASKCRIVSKEDYDKLVSNDCRPLKNDILVAKDGSYLKHIFVVEKDMNLVVLSSIAIIRPSNICSHFLTMYLKDSSVIARMKGYVSGVAIPRIVLKDFKKFKVLVPTQELQDKWYNLVIPIVHECWRLIDKNTNLRETRDLLLPKLISGELDVSQLDIDVGGITA